MSSIHWREHGAPVEIEENIHQEGERSSGLIRQPMPFREAAELHIRKERSDRGRTYLKARDEVALKWIGEQYAVNLSHVQILLGQASEKATKIPDQLTANAAMQVVGRWEKLKLASHKSMELGKPPWIWLTRRGLLELGLQFHSYIPKKAAIDHFYEVNRVRLFVERIRPEDGWVSERTLRMEQGRARSVHLPDAILRTQKGRIAIEVERSVKEKARLDAILQYLTSTYYTVYYFCTKETESLVMKRRAGLPMPEQRERLKIYRLDTLELPSAVTSRREGE